MTTELLAMLGGGASGFVFKLIGQLVANQQGTVDAILKKQSAADESHQKASTRGGEWVRRVIVCTVLFAVVIAPFILAHSPRQTVLAIVGFYFGSSTIK